MLNKLLQKLACLLKVHRTVWSYDNRKRTITLRCSHCGSVDADTENLQTGIRSYHYFMPPQYGLGEFMVVAFKNEHPQTYVVRGIKTVWFLFDQKRYYAHAYTLEDQHGKLRNYVIENEPINEIDH